MNRLILMLASLSLTLFGCSDNGTTSGSSPNSEIQLMTASDAGTDGGSGESDTTPGGGSGSSTPGGGSGCPAGWLGNRSVDGMIVGWDCHLVGFGWSEPLFVSPMPAVLAIPWESPRR